MIGGALEVVVVSEEYWRPESDALKQYETAEHTRQLGVIEGQEEEDA